jgi:uncharacterized protein YjdB
MKKFYFLTLILMFFSYSAISQMTILLVNDNGFAKDRVQSLKTSLENLAYTYVFYDTSVEGTSPTSAYMSAYDLVIWYTGNDGAGLLFWNGADTDNVEIKKYIDDGGMFWLQGLDFLYDRYGTAKDTFHVNDFVYDYLGIKHYIAQSHYDHNNEGTYDGVPYFTVVKDNGIFTLDTIKWQYATLWGADALEITDSAKALYIMAPADYGYAGKVPCLYLEKGEGKVMSMSIETAKLNSQKSLDTLFSQGLTYFSQFASGSNVPVQSLTLSAEGGANSINVKGGTLQMTATVLPANATNPNVHWSLMNNQANASIDQSGLLKAFGSSYGNGTTTVVAETVDGTGISATMDITITNQGELSDFEILLVNDNGNSPTRYKNIDTTLTNLGYFHTIFNSAATSQIPDAKLLKSFDVVMWYTGNDGVDLALWDISDSLNIKFNPAIKEYLDNGGIFWLSGLDFFYDLYGKAPFPKADNLFTPGQFIHDYMGITKYAAQSKTDDGGTGVEQMDVVLDNSICEFSPVKWIWAKLNFADAFLISDKAEPIYKMGPSTYPLALDALKLYSGVYNVFNKSKVLTFGFEVAMMDKTENRDDLVEEVLESFEKIISETKELNSDMIETTILPNPLVDNSTVIYTLKEKANVDFIITDINGERVFMSREGNKSEGQHELSISAEKIGMPSGTYFYTIKANEKFSTKKMLVIK